MNDENKIIIAGHLGGGGSIRIPHEVPEGVNSLTGVSSDVSGAKLDLTDTKIAIIDLLCEGEIHGLVTGTYFKSGVLGDIGWRHVTFTPNTPAIDTTVRWLQSVYWNDTPVAGADGKFNFQQVDVNYAKGSPNGANITDGIIDELTFSRSISERLRGGGDEFAKIYRVLNKNCIAVKVNVRVNSLVESSVSKKKMGDTLQSTIDYNIYYRPIFNNRAGGNFLLAKSETITGKITAGYIRSSDIQFDRDYSTDQAFLGWEIKIIRSTEDSTTSTVKNQTFVDSITEIYGNKYIYPDSAIVSSLFDAEYFSQIPERKFLTNLIKVKVPSNYDPITKTYDESSPWDGTFKTDDNGNIKKEWTDNPAWCYYDLLTNKRYGLGLYIDEELIDKMTLYQVSKYCDTLVSDGFGGLEPRFTCNLYINSSEDAYKLITSMASIFRGITYYSAGSIYTSQDSEKSPIYQFTNANVVDGDFVYGSSAKKARHTVAIVRYNDKDNFYKPAIEYVENTEGIRKFGIRDVEVPAFGCTSRGQAIRLGRWALLTESLEYESLSFRAGLEASFLRPGDIFQIFDAHRQSQRLGGRTYNVIAEPDSTNVILDSQITGLYPDLLYKFALLTPSFYYDSSVVTGINTDDIDNIRKPQIQYLSFSGAQTTVSGGKTIIDFNTPLDYTNYNVSGNLIWAIESSGVNTSGIITDNEWQSYRVLTVKEADSHIYDIEALQYDINKFAQIESGFSFSDTNPVFAYSAPPGPVDLQLYTTDISQHSKYINYSFNGPSDLSNVNSYRVFVKTSPFAVDDFTSQDYVIQDLPKTVTSGIYLPTDNGDYNFRVYSVSYQGILSTDYTASSISLTNINPLQDIEISSLQIITGDLLIDGIGNKTSEIYSTDSPEFGWQVGINGINLNSNWDYRITVREPSLTNIPSNHIYYEITGYKSSQSIFTFDFDDNNIAVSNQGVDGPFREYDLVVEAMNSGGYSSAGGNFSVGPSFDSDYNNPQGYDIIYANNPRPRAVNLYTGSTSTSFYSTGYATQQWITQDGEIKIYLSVSGDATTLETFFADDIAGNVLYYSSLPFTAEEAKEIIPVNPSSKVINKALIEANGNPLSAALGLFDVERQYIAIAPYDSFDIAINDRINNYLYTGLDLSNVVTLRNPSLAGSYRAWVEIELDVDITTSPANPKHKKLVRSLNSNWVVKSYNISSVKDESVEENVDNLQFPRGVIRFSESLPVDDYAIIISDTITPHIQYPVTLSQTRPPYSYIKYVDLDKEFTNEGYSDTVAFPEKKPFLMYFDTEKIHLEQFENVYDWNLDLSPQNNYTRKIFVGVMYRS